LFSDQGTHFINEAIEILTTHFLFRHTSFTTYYLQINGHAEFTNKVIGLLLTKLINENHMDWDKHLHIVLFVYKITFKVDTSHTPFQLVYGLHALMPIKYLLPTTNFAKCKDLAMTQILSIQLAKLKKLEKSQTFATKTTSMRQWNHALWTHNHYQTKFFSLNDHVLWFPKARK
jgi:hypothetical protein